MKADIVGCQEPAIVDVLVPDVQSRVELAQEKIKIVLEGMHGKDAIAK
jgi:hypothetical protein